MTRACSVTSGFDVSVIIPTFNSEPFIRRSVGSVLEQTNVSAQLIIVDDQGSDGTRVVLEDIRRSNPERSIVLEYRGSGLGQATARNRGIELAQGRYVAFLDSDDNFKHPHVLAEWVAFGDQVGLDMAGGQYTHVDAQGNWTDARRIMPTGDTPVSLMTAPNLVSATSCWQFIYRTDFLNENGIIFSPHLKQREDRLFLIEALLKAENIGILPDAVILHHDRDDSSFKQVNRSQLEQYVQHLRELNVAIAAARAANRVPRDFETANASIYYSSLLKYWSRLYIQLVDSGDGQELLSSCKAEFKTLAAVVTSFYDNVLIHEAGLANAPLDEGVTDVLRLAIDRDDDSTILGILSGRRLSLPTLKPLATDPTAEGIVCRYVSFTRDNVVSAAKSESSKSLFELVNRVILHIGAPKTGTSSLQHTLERNRLRLINNGIHYPVTGTFREHGIRRERTAGHARMISCLLNSDLGILDQLRAEIEELKCPIHTLILSCENILSTRFWLPNAGLPVILQRLGAPNVEIVVVLRKPDEWVRSLYIEQTSNPWNQFTDSFNKFVDSLASLRLFDNEFVLNTLTSSTQVSKVHVGSFEKIRKEGDVVKWFWRIAALTEFELLPISAQQANLSLSEAQAALIKIAKANPALERADLARLFQVITTDSPISKGASFLIADDEMTAFRTKSSPFISYYCNRFGVADSAPPPRADSAQPTLTLSKEMFDLLIAPKRRLPEARRGKKAAGAVTKRAVNGKAIEPASRGSFPPWQLLRGFVPNNLEEFKEAWQIWRSGLFDAQYYLRMNPDVAESGMNPLVHFLRYGAYEGRQPSASLDLKSYLDGHGDTASSEVNPLILYLRNR